VSALTGRPLNDFDKPRDEALVGVVKEMQQPGREHTTVKVVGVSYDNDSVRKSAAAGAALDAANSLKPVLGSEHVAKPTITTLPNAGPAEIGLVGPLITIEQSAVVLELDQACA